MEICCDIWENHYVTAYTEPMVISCLIQGGKGKTVWQVGGIYVNTDQSLWYMEICCDIWESYYVTAYTEPWLFSFIRKRGENSVVGGYGLSQY